MSEEPIGPMLPTEPTVHGMQINVLPPKGPTVVPYPIDRFVTTVISGDDEISEEQRLRVCAWLKANGIDPNEVCASEPITIEGRIYQDKKRHQVICFSEYHLDETGHRYADPRKLDTAMLIQRAVRQKVALEPDPKASA
ncbi:hypothetical protein ACFWV1_25905 [Streptomyces sp. NPDC058700]|uniref:hypothetical protein n=1 Tax=Streptomyces sp. NPDC058700 TaxID=3346607 RepID=UPI00364C8A96